MTENYNNNKTDQEKDEVLRQARDADGEENAVLLEQSPQEQHDQQQQQQQSDGTSSPPKSSDEIDRQQSTSSTLTEAQQQQQQSDATPPPPSTLYVSQQHQQPSTSSDELIMRLEALKLQEPDHDDEGEESARSKQQQQHHINVEIGTDKSASQRGEQHPDDDGDESASDDAAVGCCPMRAPSLMPALMMHMRTKRSGASTTSQPVATKTGGGKRKAVAGRRGRSAAGCVCLKPSSSSSEEEAATTGRERTAVARTTSCASTHQQQQQNRQTQSGTLATLSIPFQMNSSPPSSPLSSSSDSETSSSANSHRSGATAVFTQVDYVNYFIPHMTDIVGCPFYWGKIDRYEAEALLENRPEGSFLLRDSAQDEFVFSVSFRRYNRSLHARIEEHRHSFSFDVHDPGVHSSRSIRGLLEHYQEPMSCMFFEPMLLHPVKRNRVFDLQSLARAAVCDATTYAGVSQLPLPRTLKNFLREYSYRHKIRSRQVDHLTGEELSAELIAERELAIRMKCSHPLRQSD